MESFLKNKKTLTIWIVSLVAVCTLIFLGIQNIDIVAGTLMWLLNLISPLITGVVIAVILNVPMRFIESHLWQKTKKAGLCRLRRPIAFVLSLILIAGIILGIIWLVIPELVKAFGIAAQGIAGFVKRITSMSTDEISKLPLGNFLLGFDWENIYSNIQAWLRNQSGNIVSTAFGTLTTVIGGIFNIVVAFVFAIYIIFSKEKLKGQMCRLLRSWLPDKISQWLIHAAWVTSTSFRNFIAGQSIEAIILGGLCTLGMFILQIPYAPMVGALVGVTALIPVAGAFIGAGVGAFIILTAAPVKAIVFLIFILILQQLEENLIYPKVIGNKMNLSPIWILAAITVGGGIAGALGMLVSVPTTATVYTLLKEATEEREKKRLAPIKNKEKKTTEKADKNG